MGGEEDGDYVRLREIPGVGPVAAVCKGDHSDDTASEDNKVIKGERAFPEVSSRKVWSFFCCSLINFLL